jgi:hypothetical protein
VGQPFRLRTRFLARPAGRKAGQDCPPHNSGFMPQAYAVRGAGLDGRRLHVVKSEREQL